MPNNKQVLGSVQTTVVQSNMSLYKDDMLHFILLAFHSKIFLMLFDGPIYSTCTEGCRGFHFFLLQFLGCPPSLSVLDSIADPDHFDMVLDFHFEMDPD